jgi:sugar/nucleoside kinase (ribokinase family)
MTKPSFGLLTIGNALVDVISPTSEDFIADQDAKFGMKRNSMNLIEEERALGLYDAMGPATEASGGSAANTAAAFASFGGSAAYVGKIGKDQLGEFFRHDMKAVGVTHPTPPTESGTATGRSMILVTPDGSRTMNTFLGAAVELGPDDIVESEIADAAITYMEGYLFDKEPAMAAFRKAAELAHKHGRKVSLTLSDPFCVHRHRPEFIDLVENHVDILFANEEEIMALYEVSNFEDVLPLLKTKCEIVAITRSEKGSVILNGDTITQIKAEAVSQVVDTTGAGDMYAAGFLFGYTQGLSMSECGRLGSIAAAEVISHYGPRPLVALKDLIPAKAA